ncbi:two component transcriptional regulator, LuxR family [Plantibacter flavus]|uniref:LuxR family two component transcriptional regulator n=2 Tax=Plantibacter flavus TaxID=150123 RepID=A0A3N2BYL6_9MICO|nr:LuxR family two component transcriptional regulator [Plantibacter flavus]SMG35292.1 two component transcriptional regulator, LuxR family [Plantibacter flavus]
MNDTTVMLVDDQDMMRTGMAMIIGTHAGLRVIGEAADGLTAIERDAELQPDVILMDVRMPGLDGIEATRRIIDARPEARVLMLTTFDLDEYAFGGLNAGASGFLLKDAPPAELIAAIRTIAEGNAIVSPRVTRAMLDLYQGQLPDPAGRSSSPLGMLSEREHEVLRAIGRGLSNTEIAQELFLSESTVKTHVGRVLAKLELRDRVHAVIYAYRNGLVKNAGQ